VTGCPYPAARDGQPGAPPAGGLGEHLGFFGRGNRRRSTIASGTAITPVKTLVGNPCMRTRGPPWGTRYLRSADGSYGSLTPVHASAGVT
jgi:hypothetical protein